MINFIALRPPIGTLSEPVTKNKNFFYYSRGNPFMIDQKSLKYSL